MSRNAAHTLMLVNTHVYDDARVMLEARSLVNAGYRVSIIGAARKEGYPTQGDVDTIHITLTPMVTDCRPVSILRTIWQLVRGDVDAGEDVMPFRLTTMLSLLMFNAWILRLGLKLKVNVIHCHDFSPLPAAWLLSRLKSIPLVYDAHENAPDLYAGWRSRWVERAERFFLSQARIVLTVGERLAQALRLRGGSPVIAIPNGKRAADWRLSPEQRSESRRRLELGKARLIVVYVGTLDPNRDIESLLTAVAQSKNVELLIGGGGLLTDQVVAFASQKANIHWLGWLPQKEVAHYTAVSDVVYQCLKAAPGTHRGQHTFYALPNKLFEAFAAGRASIACRGVGEMGQILEEYEAALLLDDLTVDTLKSAFEKLQDTEELHRLQQNALAAYEVYNWNVSQERLLHAYASLT